MSGPLVLRGRVWAGGTSEPVDDGVVLVDGDGVVAAIGPTAAVDVPADARTVTGAWVGPGLVDAHVHLAFGGWDAMLAGGVVAVRDLGAPLPAALGWRRPGRVQVAGPILTAAGGYPATTWGADGFARFIASPLDARHAVGELAYLGVDVVKLALEPADGLPVPSRTTAAAVVDAAHAEDLRVVAHALSAAMVEQALDAGVDELAHVPVEPLPAELVDRIAQAAVSVVSTIETLTTYPGSAVTENARRLVAAGVRLVYGTDLGNGGTRPGADPRELVRLAATGLGPLGALRAATRPVVVGAEAGLVVLDADPLLDPQAWRRPLAVVAGPQGAGRLP